MHRLTAVIILALCSTVSHAVTENCWDSTFAYRVVSVDHKNNQVEVGLSASFNLFNHLMPPESQVLDVNGLAVDQPLANVTIFLSFDESECTTTPLSELSCSSVAGNRGYLDKRVFVRRYINNLGKDVPAISEVLAFQIAVNIGKENVTALVTDRPDAFLSVYFDKEICSLDGNAGGTYFGTAFFPSELTDYVKRS